MRSKMKIAEELSMRAQIAATRQYSDDLALRATGLRDEQELLEITEAMDKHPEGYEGPCLCAECRSYAV